MQNRPDHSTLLDALASFLMADVVPKLEADKALQFRVLIAANLATVVASEIRTEPARVASEMERLRLLVGPLTPTLSPGESVEEGAAPSPIIPSAVEGRREAPEVPSLDRARDDRVGASESLFHQSPGGGEGEELNRRLALALRNNQLTAEQLDRTLDHLLATARETLEVTNPRFELSEPA